MYSPSAEDTVTDRDEAYETGIPHGAPPCYGVRNGSVRFQTAHVVATVNRCTQSALFVHGTGFSDQKPDAAQSEVTMLVVSELVRYESTQNLPPSIHAYENVRLSHSRVSALVRMQHDDTEYGEQRGDDGEHYGGPVSIGIHFKMRVDDLRAIIQAHSPACM